MSNNRSNVTTHVFRGRLQYARVLGDPIPNYNKDGKEWKFDFIPEDPKGSKAELKSVDVADRLRVLYYKDEDGNPDPKNPKYGGDAFMSFKQAATRRDGTDNFPIKVEDIIGNTWPQDKLIGNDTVADVTFVVIDSGPGRFNGVYPRSIRILEHVPYESDEFAPISEDDPYYAAAKQAENEMALLRGSNPSEPENDPSDSLDDDLGDLTA